MTPARSALPPTVAPLPVPSGQEVNRRGVARRLLDLARPYLRVAVAGLFCMLMVAATELALPMIFGKGIVNEVLSPESSMSRITRLVLLIVGLMAVRGLFRYGRGYLL